MALAGTMPASAMAQAGRTRVIGVLTGYAEDDQDGQTLLAGLRQDLDRLGWVDGRNVRFEYRRSTGTADQVAAYAAELIGLNPDVILTTGGTALVSVLHLTKSVPVVFVTDTDPVALGLISSLAQPGGNATGFISFTAAMGPKWLQLLSEVFPALARVAIVRSANPQARVVLPAIQDAAAGLKLRSAVIDVEGADIERALGEATREPNTGLLVLPGATLLGQRNAIVEIAGQHRLPAIYSNAAFARAGGLMSYGVDRRERMMQAANYIDRILKGERPATLPVQMPTVFELIINLRTAAMLGLAPPPHLRALANDLID